MFRKLPGAGTHSGDISADQAGTTFQARAFVRMWTCPPKPNTVAPNLAGYTYTPIYRAGSLSLKLPYGPGSEGAQWFDPTDLKNTDRKRVFL